MRNFRRDGTEQALCLETAGVGEDSEPIAITRAVVPFEAFAASLGAEQIGEMRLTRMSQGLRGRFALEMAAAKHETPPQAAAGDDRRVTIRRRRPPSVVSSVAGRSLLGLYFCNSQGGF